MLSFSSSWAETVPTVNTPQMPVSPDPNLLSKTYAFKDLGWNSAITLNGYKPDHTFYFPTNSHFKIEKITLHLKITFSPNLAQGTQVNVKLNQNIVKRLLMQLDPVNEETWDIDLPLTHLTADWQALNFSAHLVSVENLCSSNIWIYLSPASSLTISYKQLPFSGTLNQLPYPFINLNTADPTNTLLVLPEQADPQEIISLFQVALRLGELAGDSKVDLNTTSINELSNKQAENNLILIGLADKLFKSKNYPGKMVNQNQIDGALKDQSGIVTLTPSLLNPFYGVLTLTGANLASLQKAINAFNLPEFQSFTGGNLAIIKNVTLSPPKISSNEWYQTTLKNIGYSNQSVSGIGAHKLTYMISLPNSRIPERAKIQTYITSPIFKDNDNSQLTLLVNDQKQSSFWLKKEQSAWTAEIETDNLKPGQNKVEYLIDLHLDKEQCTRQNYDEMWATIHAETQFSASFTDNFPHANLNQLPVPFDGELTVIIPDDLSPKEINTLAHLFFKLGGLFNYNQTAFAIRFSKDVDEDFVRNHNIILIGTPDRNPWVQFALGFAPAKINGNSQILNTSRSNLEVTDSQSPGLLELIRSPWSEQHAVLFITGSTESAVSLSINALINDKTRGAMNGNITMVNPDNTISVLNHHNGDYLNLMHKFTLFIQNSYKNMLYYIKNHPQILIFMIVFIVPLIIFWRRRRK